MEEAVSDLQNLIFTLMFYFVAIAAFSYLLVLPVLNRLGFDKQLSTAISKITFVLITIAAFSKHFSV